MLEGLTVLMSASKAAAKLSAFEVPVRNEFELICTASFKKAGLTFPRELLEFYK